MGLAEDGSEGIVVHGEGFLGGVASPNEFRFMGSGGSRERPGNYDERGGRGGGGGGGGRAAGRRVPDLGRGARAGARASPVGLRVVHPERVRAGGAGRQRGGGPRHRGGDLRDP